MVELLVVVAIQVAVLGAVASLYLFTVQQCGQATAAVAPAQQASAAMDAIAATVRQSMVCATQSANGYTGLRCTLPANGMDTNGDGVDDLWAPDKFAADGKPSYSKGTRVWYYQADATGAFGTAGTTLWRATRTDDSKPTAANVDAAWSLYYGGKARYALIDALTLAVSGSVVTVTLDASASARKPDASGAAANAQDQQKASLTQTLPWRTDFE